ncbi:MAG: dockerin type I domain-containing protein [Paludibacter sp.]|nr:dockerin type I domain-containing protein [Paludibacter sp.]
MKGKINVKAIVIASILVLVIVLGVIGINTARTFMSGAAGGYEPKNVSYSASPDGKSVTITWTSDKESTGVISYGSNPASLILTTQEESVKTQNHSVGIVTLKPNTTYYYKIIVNGLPPFDNEGTPWTFKTKGVDESLLPSVSPVVPSVVSPSPMPLSASSSSTPSNTLGDNCSDMNGDGIVNSADLLLCRKRTATESGSVQGVSTTDCNSNIGDYNNDGIANSLDRLKCLQDQKR